MWGEVSSPSPCRRSCVVPLLQGTSSFSCVCGMGTQEELRLTSSHVGAKLVGLKSRPCPPLGTVWSALLRGVCLCVCIHARFCVLELVYGGKTSLATLLIVKDRLERQLDTKATSGWRKSSSISGSCPATCPGRHFSRVELFASTLR